MVGCLAACPVDVVVAGDVVVVVAGFAGLFVFLSCFLLWILAVWGSTQTNSCDPHPKSQSTRTNKQTKVSGTPGTRSDTDNGDLSVAPVLLAPMSTIQ